VGGVVCGQSFRKKENPKNVENIITVSERKFNEEGVLQLSGGDFRLFTPTSSPILS
jgi:hypothetical protein